MTDDFSFQPFEVEESFRQILNLNYYAKRHIGYRPKKILPTGQIPLLLQLGAPHRLRKASKSEENPAFNEGWIDGFQTTPTWKALRTTLTSWVWCLIRSDSIPCLVMTWRHSPMAHLTRERLHRR